MKYRKKMIILAAGLMVMTVLAGCGKSEVVMDARQETAASGAAGTNTNAGSGADASGQAGQSAGNDTAAEAGVNVQAAGVNASAPVSGSGTSSGSTAAAGAANGASAAGKTGWVEEKDGWHLYDAQGTSMTGWVENEGNRYYFDRDGRMLTDWQEVGGSWFYLGTDGRMATDWQEIGGAWYYLGTDGKMQTDWQQVKGSWFYLGGDGAMRTGWQDIDGKWYYFEDSGAMLHDTTVGDYVLFSDGSAGKRLRNFEGEYKYDYGYYELSAYKNGRGLSFYMKDLGNGMLELSGDTFGALIPQSGEVILPAVDGITGVLHMEGDRGSWDENGNVIGQHVEDDISVRLVQEGDIVRLEMDDDICYPLDYLLQKYKVSFIGFPDKYIGYSLSDMEAIFGFANSEDAFQNLMFGDGDTEYYAFNGTDMIYGFTGYSVDQNVCAVCSNNPHNFFRYEGVLTLDAIIGQVAEGYESLDTYAIYAPELANTYSRRLIYVNGSRLDIDYRIEDGAVTAVYWHGW